MTRKTSFLLSLGFFMLFASMALYAQDFTERTFQTNVVVADESKDGILIRKEDAYTATTLPKEQRSVQTMSKVIDYMLNTELGDDYHTEGFFSEGCKGNWIPGIGAVFQIKVGFPLQGKAEVKPAVEVEEMPDLWERMERQVEGKAESDPAVSGKRYRVKMNVVFHNGYDEKKIANLKNTIVKAFAQFGYRLEGLTDAENIIVMVESESGPRFMFTEQEKALDMMRDQMNQLRDSSQPSEDRIQQLQDLLSNEEMNDDTKEMLRSELESLKSENSKLKESEVRDIIEQQLDNSDKKILRFNRNQDVEKKIREQTRKLSELAEKQKQEAEKQYQKSVERKKSLDSSVLIKPDRYTVWRGEDVIGQKTTMVIKIPVSAFSEKGVSANQLKDMVQTIVY